MTKSALIIYPRVSFHSSRIIKECIVLERFMSIEKVVVLSHHFSGNLDDKPKYLKDIDFETIKLASGFMKSTPVGDFIRYLEFLIKAMMVYSRRNPSLVIPHRVSVLPLAVLIKLFTGCRLIYSPHELETESVGLKGLRQLFAKKVERYLINFSNHVIVPGDEIAKWYKKNYYNVSVTSVFNVPLFHNLNGTNQNLFRTEFRISKDATVYVNQGILSKQRNTDLLMDVFKSLPSDHHIVFMGYGEYVEEVIYASTQYCNIHYKKVVPIEQVVQWTSSADIGIHIGKNTCLSYKLASPNKIYEFLGAGLPIIVNVHKPEMKGLVEKYHCGWHCTEDETFIKSLILSIDKEAIRDKTKGVMLLNRQINWESEKKKLEEVFKSTLNEI